MRHVSTIPHVLWQGLLWVWWSFVKWCAAPSHPSYIHAIWREWQTRQSIKRFIEKGE